MRKLRNTCRILVANLYDFDPATDMRAARPARRDRSLRAGALRRSREADAGAHTMRYDFSTVSQALSMLATVDLSAFYVDVTKDRIRTLAARSA